MDIPRCEPRKVPRSTPAPRRTLENELSAHQANALRWIHVHGNHGRGELLLKRHFSSQESHQHPPDHRAEPRWHHPRQVGGDLPGPAQNDQLELF